MQTFKVMKLVIKKIFLSYSIIGKSLKLSYMDKHVYFAFDSMNFTFCFQKTKICKRTPFTILFLNNITYQRSFHHEL